MKLIAVILLLFVLFLSNAFAAGPFIVSDPDPAVVHYRVRLSADNGVTWSDWVIGEPVGGGAKFDVTSVPKGIYKGELQAGRITSLTDLATGITTTVEEWSESAEFRMDREGKGNKPLIIKVQ